MAPLASTPALPSTPPGGATAPAASTAAASTPSGSATAPQVADAARAPAPPRHGVLRLINRARVEMVDAMDRALAPFEITAPQLIVLASVANREADSAAALCKSISYDPGAMTRMIDRLEQKGLVRRMPNPDDRRAMNVELTAAGKALYPQLLAVKESVQAHLLRTFSAEEIHQFESLLKRMIANR